MLWHCGVQFETGGYFFWGGGGETPLLSFPPSSVNCIRCKQTSSSFLMTSFSMSWAALSLFMYPAFSFPSSSRNSTLHSTSNYNLVLTSGLLLLFVFLPLTQNSQYIQPIQNKLPYSILMLSPILFDLLSRPLISLLLPLQPLQLLGQFRFLVVLLLFQDPFPLCTLNLFLHIPLPKFLLLSSKDSNGRYMYRVSENVHYL